jgi:hypothetical protein
MSNDILPALFCDVISVDVDGWIKNGERRKFHPSPWIDLVSVKSCLQQITVRRRSDLCTRPERT